MWWYTLVAHWRSSWGEDWSCSITYQNAQSKRHVSLVCNPQELENPVCLRPDPALPLSSHSLSRGWWGVCNLTELDSHLFIVFCWKQIQTRTSCEDTLSMSSHLIVELSHNFYGVNYPNPPTTLTNTTTSINFSKPHPHQ